MSSELEFCDYCGKPCGPKLNPRGQVKVYHWECLEDSVQESREHYKNMMKRLESQQLPWKQLDNQSK